MQMLEETDGIEGKTIPRNKVLQELGLIEAQIRSLEVAGKGRASTLNMATGTIFCMCRLGLIDYDQRNELLERVQKAFSGE